MGRVVDGESVITLREASRSLNVHPNTVRSMLRRGLLDGRRYQNDRLAYITKESVAKFKKTRKVRVMANWTLSCVMAKLLDIEQKLDVLIQNSPARAVNKMVAARHPH
jgi:IS30 family transposase